MLEIRRAMMIMRALRCGKPTRAGRTSVSGVGDKREVG